MLNGQDLKFAVISGSNNISSQKAQINDLNIFPVPDGDTGTNMSMTVMAAAKALESIVVAKKTNKIINIKTIIIILTPL